MPNSIVVCQWHRRAADMLPAIGNLVLAAIISMMIPLFMGITVERRVCDGFPEVEGGPSIPVPHGIRLRNMYSPRQYSTISYSFRI